LLATGRAATTTRQRRRTVGAVVYIGLVLALFVVIPLMGVAAPSRLAVWI
jgi:hypothetical protein